MKIILPLLIFSLTIIPIQLVFANDDCTCWIDAKTGKLVPTAPESGVNHGAVTVQGAGAAEIDPLNPDRASNAKTGQTFIRSGYCWIDAKTGKQVPTVPESGVNHGAATVQGAGAAEIDPLNPNRATNAKTGQTFIRVPCPEEKPSSTTGGVKTAPSHAAAVNDLFQLGVGYNFMRAAQEEAKNLNGFQVSGFYNVNSWLAVGGDFSGLYGSHSSGGVDVSLDRYLYLFGPQVAFQPIPKLQPVKIVGHVLVGGVHDENEFKYPGMTVRSSANAFAMTVGGGVDVQVTPHVSVGPSFDYTPTAFSSPNGDWQNNWRAGFEVKVKF